MLEKGQQFLVDDKVALFNICWPRPQNATTFPAFAEATSFKP
jgi:hypothetical protein